MAGDCSTIIFKIKMFWKEWNHFYTSCHHDNTIDTVALLTTKQNPAVMAVMVLLGPTSCTVSHFSYAPLINVQLHRKEISYCYSGITSVKRIYIWISLWNFIVIRSEMNEKMDLEEHYPQNTISHCIISNETQITSHFFLSRISAMPEKTTGLFFNLAISKTATSLLTSSCFKCFTVFGSTLAKVSKTFG